MYYQIRLVSSEEGWTVSCPSLPGCHPQGTTWEESVENIKTAILEWLQVEAQEAGAVRIEEIPLRFDLCKASRHQPRHAVRVFTELGFRVTHEGKHTVMSNDMAQKGARK